MFRSGLLCVGDCRGRWRWPARPSRNRPSTCRPSSNCRAPAPCPAPISATACCWRSTRSTPRAAFSASKIDMPLLDTQSDAGISRAQVQKVLDNKPYVILGPVFSGSVLVDMLLTAAGRNSGNRRRRSRGDHAEGQSLRLPHLVRPAIQHAEDRQLHPRRRQGEDRRRAVGQQRFRQRRSRQFHEGDEGARHQGRRRHLHRTRARPISPPTSSSSRAPMPTRSSSISTKKRARASSEKPRSRASTRR